MSIRLYRGETRARRADRSINTGSDALDLTLVFLAKHESGQPVRRDRMLASGVGQSDLNGIRRANHRADALMA
jgi:hypothetical protein